MISSLLEFSKQLEQGWAKDLHSERALLFLNQLQIEQSLPAFEKEMAIWLKNSEIPSQVNLYNNFGEPSVTLFNNGKFAVDIYFWRNNDTIIHSHGFRGAFKVIYGQSLHEQFNLNIINTFADDIQQISLVSDGIEVLKQGECRLINQDLTHRVVHLDNPTVTLCIRTVEDIELCQWHHLPTGLSYKKKNLSEKIIKQVLYFQYLLSSDDQEAETYLGSILGALDISSQISLYESLCYGEIGLDDASFNILDMKFKSIFESEDWFDLYKNYFESLNMKLKDSTLLGAPLKLLIHAINNNYPKKELIKLVANISNINFKDLCEKLMTCEQVFKPGYEKEQLAMIKKYL